MDKMAKLDALKAFIAQGDDEMAEGAAPCQCDCEACAGCASKQPVL